MACARRIQRACGPADIGHPSGCTGLEGDISGEPFLFRVGCDAFRRPPEFRTDEEVRLRMFASTLSGGQSIDIHGFASEEGSPAFNDDLSCARAIRAAAVISAAAPGLFLSLFKTRRDRRRPR